MNEVDPFASSPNDIWLLAVFIGIPLLAAFFYGVLILTAALGIPGVAMFQRFRNRQTPEKPGEEVELDDLF